MAEEIYLKELTTNLLHSIQENQLDSINTNGKTYINKEFIFSWLNNKKIKYDVI